MKQKIDKTDFVHERWDKILKNERVDIVVNDNQMRSILKKINYDIDEKGYIIDMKTGTRVESNDGTEIKLNELGAVIPGTKNFIKNNIVSFSQFLAEHNR